MSEPREPGTTVKDRQKEFMELGRKLSAAPSPILDVLRKSDIPETPPPAEVTPHLILRRATEAKTYTDWLHANNITVVKEEGAAFFDTPIPSCLHCGQKFYLEQVSFIRARRTQDIAIAVDRKNGYTSIKTKRPHFYLQLPSIALHALEVHGSLDAEGTDDQQYRIDPSTIRAFLNDQIQDVPQMKRYEAATRPSRVPSSPQLRQTR